MFGFNVRRFTSQNLDKVSENATFSETLPFPGF